MEGNNEEDYLDSLLDSVSVIKDDVVDDEFFDEDTNELIGKLNDIMNEVNDNDISEKSNSIIDSEDESQYAQTSNETQPDMSDVSVQDLDIDDELKELLSQGDNEETNNKEGNSSELSQEDVERLAQLDLEHGMVQSDVSDVNEAENALDEFAGIDNIPDLTDAFLSQNDLSDNSLDNLPDDLDTLIAEEKGEGKKGFFSFLFSGKKKKDKKQKKNKKGKKGKKENSRKNVSDNEDDIEDSTDENARVLNEVFDENGELLEEGRAPVKKSFFSFASGDKGESGKKSSKDDDTEEEAPESKKKKEKKPKKQKEKKPPKKKKEKKPKKQKAKKPPKPKKEKVPPKPSELVKISLLEVIIMLIFIVGIPAFIYISITAFNYKNNIETATAYLLEDNYDKAFECIEGLELKNDEDKTLYKQIASIMFVKKQYNSYYNYKKLGMEYEALDALIKGIQRFEEFRADGEELGVIDDMTSVRNDIIYILESEYGINEALAVTYSEIEDYIQYYYIVNSYGGHN